VLGRWLAVIVCGALIYLGSSRPLPADYVPPVPHLDKTLHFVAYGVLALLCFRAMWAKRDDPAPAWVLLLGVVLAGAYGACEELHQSFIPGRDASVYDVIANGLGAVAAAVLWEPLGRRYGWLK
jgi:VanZ family protein